MDVKLVADTPEQLKQMLLFLHDYAVFCQDKGRRHSFNFEQLNLGIEELEEVTNAEEGTKRHLALTELLDISARPKRLEHLAPDCDIARINGKIEAIVRASVTDEAFKDVLHQKGLDFLEYNTHELVGCNNTIGFVAPKDLEKMIDEEEIETFAQEFIDWHIDLEIRRTELTEAFTSEPAPCAN